MSQIISILTARNYPFKFMFYLKLQIVLLFIRLKSHYYTFPSEIFNSVLQVCYCIILHSDLDKAMTSSIGGANDPDGLQYEGFK